MNTLPTVNIKGKEYVQVKDRILYLYEKIKDYSIETSYEYFQNAKLWVVKAKLTIGNNSYTGLAQEVQSDNYKEVNYASALENAETSAVGRACAMAGIGVIDSIASADEVRKAGNRQYNTATSQKPINKNSSNDDMASRLKPCDQCGSRFILREGKYGKFFSCSGYKEKGCRNALKLKDAEMWMTSEATVEHVFGDGTSPS